MAPAHLPLLKPQHPEAQSASLVQGPVMNWLPGATEGAGVVGATELAEAATALDDAAVAEAAGADETDAAAAEEEAGASPRSLRAALSLGWASPNPHPPSRSCATIAPAHLPVLKPQQPDAQSASLVQGPVMNWLPGATEGAGVVGAEETVDAAAGADEADAMGAEEAEATAVDEAGSSPRSLRAALSFG